MENEPLQGSFDDAEKVNYRWTIWGGYIAFMIILCLGLYDIYENNRFGLNPKAVDSYKENLKNATVEANESKIDYYLNKVKNNGGKKHELRSAIRELLEQTKIFIMTGRLNNASTLLKCYEENSVAELENEYHLVKLLYESKSGNYQEAKNQREAVKSSGHYNGAIVMVIIYSLLDEGKYDEVFDEFKRLESNNKHVGYLYNKAYFSSVCPDEKYRDGKEALRIAEEVLNKDGNSKNMYYEIKSLALAELGDFKGAESAMEDFIKELGPGAKEIIPYYQPRFDAIKAGKPYRLPKISEKK